MPNMYKKMFNDCIKDLDIKSLYVTEKLSVNGNEVKVLKCLPNQCLLEMCQQLAIEKAKYTMDQDQRGEIRSQGEKESKQLEGIIAETYCHLLLMQHLPDWQILRYDLERDSFNYSTDEYDIKIKKDDKEYEFEIRNSYSYKTSIAQGYAKLDVLGAYVNIYKLSEQLSDFFIRPLFQLNPPEGYRRYAPKFNSADELLRKIFDGSIIPYICCGTDKNDLIKNGYQSTFNQGSTKYQAIKMVNTKDIIDFIEYLQKI